MSTLAEIEAASEQLSEKEQEDLVVFLLQRLGSRTDLLPTPRSFTEDRMQEWFCEDEREGRAIREMLGIPQA